MHVRLRLIAAAAVIALSVLLFPQAFPTAWSNRSDPGNAQFFLMKEDPVLSVHPRDAMFTVG